MENLELMKQDIKQEITKEVSLSPFATQQGFEAVQRVCHLLASSDLVPKIYQLTNNPKTAIANCLIAFEMANRLGASPLSIMQSLYIVHGQPAWSSKFLIATINGCGRFQSLRYEERGTDGSDNFGVRCYSYEKTDVNKENPLFGSWVDINMAKKEGWYAKTGSKWQTMPTLMLQYRAAAFWSRVYAPELSMGLLTQEERSDIVDVNYEEVNVNKGGASEAAADFNKSLKSKKTEQTDEPTEK